MNEMCICGHGKDTHEYAVKPACAVLLHKRNDVMILRCPCLEFRLDNLKYLEAMAFRNGY